jgi:phosphate starvation-inducible PhoH-like protein
LGSKRPKKPQTIFVPKTVTARTDNQREVLRSIKYNDLTVCIGPPGSGKTLLSVGSAVQWLRSNTVERIIISRPIIEAAGERIGFLPGSASEKIHPYLIPIFEELEHFVTKEELLHWKANNRIDIVPFAHMRGRNFHKCFVILDEMQNATYEQLKLVLTRFGNGSKMVLNGDPNQSDLPLNLQGGLERIAIRLKDVIGVGITELEKDDIFRSEFVKRIIERLD